MVTDYLLTLAAIYAAMLALYFGFGLLAEAYAARFPERKIQPERDGMKRKRQEILNSLPALAMSSFLLGTGYFAQTQGWTMAPAELGIGSFILGLSMQSITGWQRSTQASISCCCPGLLEKWQQGFTALHSSLCGWERLSRKATPPQYSQSCRDWPASRVPPLSNSIITRFA